MQSDPLTTFSVLWRSCLTDDEDSTESLLTVTALSFGLGMIASLITAYFLGATHLFL